jgi:hypothetical protein
LADVSAGAIAVFGVLCEQSDVPGVGRVLCIVVGGRAALTRAAR